MNLNAEQKSLIVGVWKKDDFNWLFEIGMDIYCEIFRLDPSMKSLFPYVQQCEAANKDVKESSQFRNQALRFVQILNLVVSHIATDDPTLDEFDKTLFQLGERHRKFVQANGFKAECWNMFENATIRVIENEYNNEFKQFSQDKLNVAMEGWKKVCTYIIRGMVKGFSYDRNRCKQRVTNLCTTW